MRTFIDIKAFGYAFYFFVNPHQGWQRPYSEPVGGGTAYWFGPVHGAICKVR